MSDHQNRRNAIKNILLGSAALGSSSMLSSFKAVETINDNQLELKGNINHSVCAWCFSSLSLDELCLGVKDIGFSAIDLVGPKGWPTLKKHGVFSSMCNFSGNRRGMDDETGLSNAVEGLKKIVGLAEKNGIILQMELLNSKIDHKDYMCSKSDWGIELCKRVGSENFKLLYDIYHMQIDEGDVIRTIQNSNQYFGHYHTAGVPGRHEIDETQELNYPAIMRAILATGFKNYVAQEFIPAKEDKLKSLKEAVLLCDV